MYDILIKRPLTKSQRRSNAMLTDGQMYEIKLVYEDSSSEEIIKILYL